MNTEITKQLFKEFMLDKSINEMKVSGPAGSGKTTLLNDLINHLVGTHVPTIVTAYTHKAKGVIMSKVSPKADVQTLHAFLKLRPGINPNATKRDYITMSQQFGDPEPVQIIIVDEFSMVNDDDYKLLKELKVKLLFLGDGNQLESVNGESAKFEKNKYSIKLTHIYRQEGNTGLLDPLCSLVDMIENEGRMYYLEPTDQFIREADIVQKYIESDSTDKVLLAFTNNRVEYLNREINNVLQSDYLWSPTIRETLLPFLGSTVSVPSEITMINGELLKLGTKWKSLEQLIKLAPKYNLQFGQFVDGDGYVTTRCFCFGHGAYNELMKELKQRATDANLAITKITDEKPAVWAKNNYRHQFARVRASAWRELLTIDGNVICIDYPYATTVHKSQGSTYEEVFVDSEDISKVKSASQFKKLMYVAISRASEKAYLNT